MGDNIFFTSGKSNGQKQECSAVNEIAQVKAIPQQNSAIIRITTSVGDAQLVTQACCLLQSSRFSLQISLSPATFMLKSTQG
ncbi:hypothetical protein NQZ68_004414 [Dissostichus eleginoides]|nr:hypothetical protein NQZ68_004414 [Dissostichus eleginoides]